VPRPPSEAAGGATVPPPGDVGSPAAEADRERRAARRVAVLPGASLDDRVPSPTILLVEDDAADVRLVREALATCPRRIRLVVGSDGLEALRLF
jgi:hypothetical protein